MEEKIYTTKKNGMKALLLILLSIGMEVALVVIGGVLLSDGPSALGVIFEIIGIVGLVLCWIPMLCLKVLKPQEALVLTLFGDYKGTIREQGFYFVNPFLHTKRYSD